MTAKFQEAERLVGSVLGKRFEIVSCVEADEVGARYQAQDTGSDSPAMVRVLHRLRPDDASLKQLVSLLNEVSGLGISGVTTLRGVGRTRSRDVYYATDAVPGQSLNQLLASHPPAPSEAVTLINGVAEILELAHGGGLVHGALHPGAVMVDGKGSSQTLHLLDFGLGPLLSTGEMWPTGSQSLAALYQAPEQAKGDSFDHRADIYALGALLFHLLTGSAPFSGQSPLEILACQLRGEAPSLGAVKPALEDSPLQSLVDQCMKVEAGERFQAVGSFIRSLENVGRQEAARKRPQAAAPAKGKAKAKAKGKGKAGSSARPAGKAKKPAGNGARAAPTLPRGGYRGASSGGSSWLWYALGATILFGAVAVVGLIAMDGSDSPVEAVSRPAQAQPAPPAAAEKSPPVAPTKRKRTPFGGVQPSEGDGGTQNAALRDAIKQAAEKQVTPLPERAVGLVAEGNKALDDGQYSRAISRFRSAKRAAPEAAVIARGLGMAYLHAGQTDAAATEFQRYLRLEPNASDGMMIRHTLRQLGVLD